MTRVADLQIGVFQPFRLLLGYTPHDKLGHRPRWDGLVPAACWYCSQAQVERAAVDGSCPSLSLSGLPPCKNTVAERDTADLAISHHGETELVSHSHFGRYPVAFAHLGPAA